MIIYTYGKMLEKAEEIRRKSPALLEANDWEAIRSLLTFDEEVWDGPAAESYRKLVEALYNGRDERAKEVVAEIPNLIEKDVQHMQEVDHRVAEMVRNNFQTF